MFVQFRPVWECFTHKGSRHWQLSAAQIRRLIIDWVPSFKTIRKKEVFRAVSISVIVRKKAWLSFCAQSLVVNSNFLSCPSLGMSWPICISSDVWSPGKGVFYHCRIVEFSDKGSHPSCFESACEENRLHAIMWIGSPSNHRLLWASAESTSSC